MLTHVQRFVVAAFTQVLLYGIYLATLIQYLRWFIFTDEGWKLREKVNFNFITTFATIFVFLTSTTNLVASLQYTLGFLRRDENWDKYGTMATMSISELLAIISIDGVLIYRCWVVYEKSWRVICVPVTFWLASLTCSAIYLYLNLEGQPLNVLQIEQKVLIGLDVCNIATTIYTTTAIIYRIWCTKKISGGSTRRLSYIMRILAESGALYTCTLIFGIVGLVLTSGNDPTWFDFLVGDISDAINLSMAGISFNLLLIRVYQSRVELRDSLADSRNDDGVRSLSGMQFKNPQITPSSEGPPSNARPVDEVIDEIQEHHRSSDEIHVN